MPQNQETPEKALLHLIEKPHATVKRPGSGGKKGFGAVLKSLFAKKKKMPPAAKGQRSPQVNIRVLNIALVSAIIGVACYLTASTFISLEDIEKRLRFEQPVYSPESSQTVEDPFRMKESEYYRARLDDRDIFKIGGRLTKEIDEPKKVDLSPKVVEATRNLRLVGISWSDNPDAMIEDVARHMTFFLKKGDVMESGIRVKRIYKDKVILVAEDHEIELQ